MPDKTFQKVTCNIKNTIIKTHLEILIKILWRIVA